MTATSLAKRGPDECGIGEWFRAATHPKFGVGFLEFEWTPKEGGCIRVFRRLRCSIDGRSERIWYRYF